jgi:transcriptional regulator of acetoin/glycerol metabolism
VPSRAQAVCEPTEQTSQPQALSGAEAPKTTMKQEPELACLTYAERKKKISRDKRYARYEHVLALHQAGMGQRAIAREIHMSRRIVHR